MSYTRDVVYQIWNDQTGARIEIGPDRDALGLIEVRAIEGDGRAHASMCMTSDEAKMVAEAILEVIK